MMTDEVLAPSVIEAAERCGSFSLFLSAVERAGLTETLRGGDGFTVFAPTDTAIDEVPSATWSKLMGSPRKELLLSVIGYHFAPGVVLSARFVGKKMRAISFEGRPLHIDGTDGISVGGAKVVMPDMRARNGVIHGIDRLLWPRSPTRTS